MELGTRKIINLCMCFSYSLKANPQTQLPLDFQPALIPEPGFFFSGFAHPQLPIQHQHGAELAQWGLIPSWVKLKSKANELQKLSLNARWETAHEKPMFREAWKTKPCLILASGFFEWQTQGKTKIPYFIHPSEGDFFLFGGIFDDFIDSQTGEVQRTYSILTTDANELMSNIHNVKKRMPVIIDSRQADQWLFGDLEDRASLCKPVASQKLDAYEVSRNLNSTKLDRNQAWAVEPEQNKQNNLVLSLQLK